MSSNRREYEKRVNAVIDYLRERLAEDLSLRILARVAAFSPFHFHRVFRAITGETLFGFIQRLRVEKAATALIIHPDESVLAVALDHGFASSATFARAFKAHFGMSATAWRAGGAQRWRGRQASKSNPGKQLRKAGKASRRRRPDTPRKRTEEGHMTLQVRESPPYHVAYMRYVGPYGARGIPELWTSFRKWMGTRDLPMETTIRLGVGYDDPSITAAEKCRYDACVVVAQDFKPDRWVNVMDLPSGKCAVYEFTGGAHDIVTAWDRAFASWLPGSGYQPDDRPCCEVYRGATMVDAKKGIFRCELWLPVRAL